MDGFWIGLGLFTLACGIEIGLREIARSLRKEAKP